MDATQMAFDDSHARKAGQQRWLQTTKDNRQW